MSVKVCKQLRGCACVPCMTMQVQKKVQDQDIKWHIVSRDKRRKAWQARILHEFKNKTFVKSHCMSLNPSANEQLLMDETGSGLSRCELEM